MKTRANPKGLRRKIVPSEGFKIGNGRYITAYADAVPTREEQGVDVREWGAVSVHFYGDPTTYAGSLVTMRPWRFYKTAEYGTGTTRRGRWVADVEEIIPVDPALVTGARGQTKTYPTLGCEKMFWQVVSENLGALAWLVTQPYGWTKREDTYATVSGSGGGGDGGGGSTPMATHDLPVIAEGPQTMDEAKTFDGAALPNNVAEGDAVRSASTERGIRYVMPVNETGSDSPVGVYDAAIAAGTGGTAVIMAGTEGKRFDGSALPNTISEGDVGRLAASLGGIQYVMPVIDSGASSPLSIHDSPSGGGDGYGVAVMMAGAEAETVGSLGTVGTDGDATRIKATRSGILYGILADIAGNNVVVVPHDTAISQAAGGSAVVMQGVEAKAFDGSALPNQVGEGDAARQAANTWGIAYSMPVNEQGSDTPVAVFDTAISAAAGGSAVIMAGAEAKDFDGAAFPNPVTNELDATRLVTSLSGVQYVMQVNEDGSGTPVVAHDAVIGAAVGGSVGFMNVVEAKTFDGSALPNTVAEGDAIRSAATLSGVGYSIPVLNDGSSTPLATHDSAVGGADGLGVSPMIAGAEANSSQQTAVDDGDAVRIAANLYGEIVNAAYIWANQANRVEEDDPLDTRDVGDAVTHTDIPADATTIDYIDMTHYHFLTIQLNFAAALGVGVTVEATAQDDGTVPASCFYTDVTNAWFGAASYNADTILEADVATTVKYVRVIFDNTGGAATEDVDAYYRRSW